MKKHMSYFCVANSRVVDKPGVGGIKSIHVSTLPGSDYCLVITWRSLEFIAGPRVELPIREVRLSISCCI